MNKQVLILILFLFSVFTAGLVISPTYDPTALHNLYDDTDPCLGGDLDGQSYDIVDVNNITALDDITAGDNLIASRGFVGTPSHTFTGYPTTGMWYQPGGSGLSFAEGGVNRLSLTSLGAHFNTGALSGVTNITASGIIKVSDGSVGAPSFASTTEPTTGIYFGPLGIHINLTTEATRVFSLSDLGADFYVPLDLKANALTVNSNEIVGSDGEVNKNVIEDSPNWDAAYDHVSDVNEHIDWTNTASNFLTSGTLASGAQTITGTLTTTSYLRPGHADFGLETNSPKIEGDVSGVNSRLWIRPDGSDKKIALIFAPSGTADGASFQLQNAESATDRGRFILNIVGTTAEIKTGYQTDSSLAPTVLKIGEYNVGTPKLATIEFTFDGVTKTIIDSNGWLRLGSAVAPTATLDVDGDANVYGTLDVNDVTVNGVSSLSGTYTFGGGGSGDIASMTFTSGILTAVTTVP